MIRDKCKKRALDKKRKELAEKAESERLEVERLKEEKKLLKE